MGQTMRVAGVPKSLVHDGWWLDADFDAPHAETSPRFASIWKDRKRRRMLLFLLILGAADVLLFRHAPGLSVAVLALLIYAASLIEAAPPKIHAGPLATVIAGVLPVVEHLQFVSVLFAIAGLVVAVTWQRLGPDATLPVLNQAARRFLAQLPLAAIRDMLIWGRSPGLTGSFKGQIQTALHHWAIPAGGGVLLFSLLLMANPVLETWVNGLTQTPIDGSVTLARAGFWLAAGLLIWPFLAAEPRTVPTVSHRHQRPVRRFGLNATSVTNALVIFNALLALQLILDSQSFWLGSELPDGITYANYAHRGAYPLLVTALLAGGFALAARPFLSAGPWVRPLMLIWLGLNVLLTLSSLYRLGLYVDAYGLTYMRVRAAIWMVLVALWLGLIGWQIWAARANGWLLLRSWLLGVSVVYAGCFVNFGHIIAAHNLNHFGTKGYYHCHLPDTAAAAYWVVDTPQPRFLETHTECAPRKPEITGWRDWGFRAWRVASYIETLNPVEAAHENPGR